MIESKRKSMDKSQENEKIEKCKHDLQSPKKTNGRKVEVKQVSAIKKGINYIYKQFLS